MCSSYYNTRISNRQSVRKVQDGLWWWQPPLKEHRDCATESRTRIAEVLNPEQRTRYEAMVPARTRGSTTSGRLWTPDEAGRAKPVNVRVGLTDGSYSELVSGEVPEGTPVIVGILDSAKTRAQQKSAPRFGF